jgi:predicted HicB family RNase H-like nuclease
LPPDQVASSQIHLRVTRQRKAAYVRAANRTQQTLAAWCFDHLDKAAGHKPE